MLQELHACGEPIFEQFQAYIESVVAAKPTVEKITNCFFPNKAWYLSPYMQPSMASYLVDQMWAVEWISNIDAAKKGKKFGRLLFLNIV